MPFAQFMALALYDPQVGYYRQNRRRVGFGTGTDFYTSTSVGSLFGELIIQSCLDLAGADFCARACFVEIGAEPDGGILRDVTHPFASTRTLRIGAPLDLTGPCIVFSNELFDAQPCRRFVKRESGWHEVGVQLANGILQEVDLPLPTTVDFLPVGTSNGYHLDAPRAAVDLLEEIVSQSWDGLFIACDYGKTWLELSEETPRGTVRAYQNHRQSNDLYTMPGGQDLTCHVCWDWLEASLRNHRFKQVTTESQEAFFIRHAAKFMAATAAQEAAKFSERKLALMQLIHPSNLGQKFQVLHATRGITKDI